jgi:hypothetical protein
MAVRGVCLIDVKALAASPFFIVILPLTHDCRFVLTECGEFGVVFCRHNLWRRLTLWCDNL